MLSTKLLAMLAAGLVACPGAEAALVTVSPSAQSVTVGATFTVDVSISALGAGVAPSLGVFDFDFGFDASWLAFQSAAFGAGLDVLGLGSIQAATPGAGTINLFELSLDSVADLNDLQGDSFVLATITFVAQAEGAAPFSLSANAFGDAEGNALDVTFGDPGSVTVLAAPDGSIPEPGTYGLAALGLFGAGLASRRRRVSATFA